MTTRKVTVRCVYCHVNATFEKEYGPDFEKPYIMKKCKNCHRINQKATILNIQLVEELDN